MPSAPRSYDEPGWSLLGAIIEGPGGPWFFKGVGPKTVMADHDERFKTMIRSVRAAGGGSDVPQS